eukprot:2673074-Prymnesium_polylepis.1
MRAERSGDERWSERLGEGWGAATTMRRRGAPGRRRRCGPCPGRCACRRACRRPWPTCRWQSSGSCARTGDVARGAMAHGAMAHGAMVRRALARPRSGVVAVCCGEACGACAAARVASAAARARACARG